MTRERRPVTRELGAGRRGAVRPRAAALIPLAALLATACSPGAQLDGPTLTGSGNASLRLAVDRLVRAPILETTREFQAVRRTRFYVSTGTPEQAAMAVKDGMVVDVVILPKGAALNRVRDELVTPPVAFGVRDGVTYEAAAVTSTGLLYVRYLQTAGGEAVLGAAGFTDLVMPPKEDLQPPVQSPKLLGPAGKA